jgi:small subunit ribosomal protein S6
MSLRRVYESIIIINAALEDQDIESVITKVNGYVENHGGEVQETSHWGRRRLAYPINKKYNGYYVHITFEAAPSAIPILDRFLVLEDTVLRHLTLLLPKRLRDYRAKRSVELGKPYDQAIFERQEQFDNKNKKKFNRPYHSDVVEAEKVSDEAETAEKPSNKGIKAKTEEAQIEVVPVKNDSDNE